MSPVDPNGSWTVVALIIWPETKSCSPKKNLLNLLRNSLPSVTTTRVKSLDLVRLLYQRINILIRLCLSNLLDTIYCLYQSYVIWVCLFCFLLRVVLCFHRMTILLSSRASEKEISTLFIFFGRSCVHLFHGKSLLEPSVRYVLGQELPCIHPKIQIHIGNGRRNPPPSWINSNGQK